MATFVNTTNFFEKNVKACSQTNLFTPFGLLMVLCGLKQLRMVEYMLSLIDLKDLFPENQLLSEED